MRPLHASTLAVMMLLASRQEARADVDRHDCPSPLLRCSSDRGLSFEWQQTAFDGVDVDTGWLPANSNVQARFAVRLAGNSEVSFQGGLDAEWDGDGVQAQLRGETDAGWMSIGYGLEITTQFRFNVSVFGQSASWTGSIPTPLNLPSDLLVAAQSTFTPWRLPGASPESVTVSDETGRVSAFVIGLGDDIIDVPGIGGHFALEVAASLQGEYRDESVTIESGTAIESANTASNLEAADASTGYGPAIETTVRPRGRLQYTPGVTLYPNVRLVVFGITVINKDLFTLHLNLPSFGSQVDFDAAPARLPLPDLHVQTDAIRLRGASDDPTLTIENRGEKSLLVEIENWPEELEAGELAFAIEPNTSHEVALVLRPDAAAVGVEQTRSITLRSNDPDAEMTVIDLDLATASDESDDEPFEVDPALDQGAGAGCGCQSGGGPQGSSALPFLLAFALLAWRRRRGPGPVR